MQLRNIAIEANKPHKEQGDKWVIDPQLLGEKMYDYAVMLMS
jgi:hypothetical protein